MKKLVYKLSIVWAILHSSLIAYGQTPDWNTSGNTLLQTGILGNSANFDILFRTDNTDRMRLMESGNYNIDGYNIDNSGFLYLGLTPSALTNREAQSVLHIDGTGNNQGLPQTLGFRDWMRPGISFTHNSDRMYVGPKAGEAQDETEAVINWSDNDASFPGLGPDVLRFLFTGQGGGSTLISGDPLDDQDYDGVEVARMTGDAKMGVGPRWTNDVLPKRALDVVHRNKDPQFRLTYDGDDNDIQGGSHADFQVDEEGNTFIKPELNGARAPLVIGFLNDEEDDPYNPTYLDVAGLTRIRNLPSDPNPDCLILGWSLDIVNGAAPEDQFLNRLDFPDVDDPECWGLSGDGTWINFCDQFTDLDWETDGTDVWTGHGLNGFPDSNVGVGVVGTNTTAKLHVQTTGSILPNQTTAIKAEVFPTNPGTNICSGLEINASGGLAVTYGSLTYISNNSSPINIGDELKISTPASSNYGFSCDVGGADNQNYGVYSKTENIGAIDNYAVFGEACNASRNFAIYGKTCGTNNGNFAGYFEGDFTFTGSFIPPSDENLKTDVQNIEGATETLNQLAPKIYSFNQDAAGLNLPEGPQMGLIAQEVEEILPFLVQSITKPAVMDSSGNVLEEEFTYKGLKYLDFIALLIAGFNEHSAQVAEQDQIIEDQENTIEELENQLADLSESLGQLQESVAQLNAVVEQNQAKSTDCCEKISNLMGDAEYQGTQSSLEVTMPRILQG